MSGKVRGNKSKMHQQHQELPGRSASNYGAAVHPINLAGPATTRLLLSLDDDSEYHSGIFTDGNQDPMDDNKVVAMVSD